MVGQTGSPEIVTLEHVMMGWTEEESDTERRYLINQGCLINGAFHNN